MHINQHEGPFFNQSINFNYIAQVIHQNATPGAEHKEWK